ncbi:sigma 54-interacting transcriptional regulator [uncultured Chitinophaga sp.]|uniref:sigma 54-interacting transcriptional regulator n=1 Tax=uncultured Chitinophaga sp. TaxID=339340 RepID=UPI0025F385CD|nr:sigma 54-interacting transcriptional regulator [uncultured Chitinophaga sp.]
MTQAKILIVEDELIVARDLQMIVERAGYQVCGTARSVDKALELIMQETPSLVLLDIFLHGKETGIDLARQLRAHHIAFMYLSANSSPEILAAAKQTQPYGFLVKPFRERDVLVTIEIALYLHQQNASTRRQQAAALTLLMEKQKEEDTSLPETLEEVAHALQPLLHFDFLLVHNETGKVLAALRTGFNHYKVLNERDLAASCQLSEKKFTALLGNNLAAPQPVIYNDAAFKQFSHSNGIAKLLSDTFHLQSTIQIPLPSGQTNHCCLAFFSRKTDAYFTEYINFLQGIAAPLVALLTGKYQKAASISGKPRTTDCTSIFDNIIGSHHLLLQAFDEVKQVASVDTSVLITGESGTGKERIAECIHKLSPRRDKPLVKVNCAALPEALINSELFGHEKGAFTGATERRTGKFEQAHEGSIFLDEIGEMPLELQSRLLRVLQEREIERLGGKTPVKIDVRIIAATNRNLENEVAAGRFRLDLYYRLHIFPIHLPALRDRKEDIPALVHHFLKMHSQKINRANTDISSKALAALVAHNWPGNIRELEHVIERSVVMAKDGMIREVVIRG